MKPLGALQQIGRKFVRISKWEGSEALERFVSGDEFLRLFATVHPTMRVTVLKSYQQASAKCRKHQPPAPGTRKAQWDALSVKRFEAIWTRNARGLNRHRDIVRKVALEMQITEGAVAMAYSRFIKHGATATHGLVENASRKPQDGRSDRRPSFWRPGKRASPYALPRRLREPFRATLRPVTS